MKPVSSGLTIPWEDFKQVLSEEQIFHAQHCPAKKDACLGVWGSIAGVIVTAT
jgi:hypothetical protein